MIEEYTNEELDKLCAKAQGWELEHFNEPSEKLGLPPNIWRKPDGHRLPLQEYTPTTNKAQAMELLEKFDLMIQPAYTTHGKIYLVGRLTDNLVDLSSSTTAPSPALAICRAIAAMYLEKENDTKNTRSN